MTLRPGKQHAQKPGLTARALLDRKAARLRVRSSVSLCYIGPREKPLCQGDMNINHGGGENSVLYENDDDDGSAGMQFLRSGGKGKDPDPTFTPDRGVEIEEEDGNQEFTRVTRRRSKALRTSRATGSPSRLATKKAAQRAVVRIIESEGKVAAEVVQNDQIALLRKLVESLLRQIQGMNEAQEVSNKAMNAKFDALQAAYGKQGRTIEALHALSKEQVRPPTWSQVAQTGNTPPNEAQEITISPSPKKSSDPQSARHDERAVSIDTSRAKVDTTEFQTIKDKLQ